MPGKIMKRVLYPAKAGIGGIVNFGGFCTFVPEAVNQAKIFCTRNM